MIFTRVSHPDVTIDVLSDLCTGALINISVESLVIDMRDDVGIEKLTEVSINVLTSEAVDIGIGTLVGAGIIVMVPSVVNDMEFAVSVSYAVDALVDVWSEKLTAVDSGDVTLIVTASGIGVDMLADVDANAFAAGMADLKFIVSTPLTDSAPFC